MAMEHGTGGRAGRSVIPRRHSHGGPWGRVSGVASPERRRDLDAMFTHREVCAELIERGGVLRIFKN